VTDQSQLEAAGWRPVLRDDFAYFVGPFLENSQDGRRIFGFLADQRHINDRGVVHGGMLMTFADQAFGELVLDSVDHSLCATIQLNTHFIAAVQAGDFVIGRGEIVRRTRSVVFVRGTLSVGNRQVAGIDGIWKVLKTD
jgi:uncharacterized protein (TIGR00369 family)